MNEVELLAALDASIEAHRKALLTLLDNRNELAEKLGLNFDLSKQEAMKRAALLERCTRRTWEVLADGSARTPNSILGRLSAPQRDMFPLVLEALGDKIAQDDEGRYYRPDVDPAQVHKPSKPRDLTGVIEANRRSWANLR